MKIILLKDIPKIGRKNDIKDIADGYALNFILPRGLGMKATDSEVKKITLAKVNEQAEMDIQDALLKKSLDEISTITVTIIEKVNEKGHLFEGLNKQRIVKEIEKTTGIQLEADFIELAKPIKEVGQFIIQINAHGKKGKVNIVVEGK